MDLRECEDRGQTRPITLNAGGSTSPTANTVSAITTSAPSRRLSNGLVVLLVAGTGGLVVYLPTAALGIGGLVLLWGASRVSLVALLTALIAVTAIVPVGVQQQLGTGGGAGLILSDLLLFAGLIGAAPYLLRRQRTAALARATAAIVGFLAIACLQFMRGVVAGRDLSLVGYELRVLLGFGGFLIAVPIITDPQRRRRFIAMLPAIGLAVGLWGLAQWVFAFNFTASADAGVREGVRLTSSGRGQLQGGLFAFPVALLTALGALLSGQVRSTRLRVVLVVIMALNAASLVLTYERTFWIATTIGAAFVIVKFGAAQRYRAALGGVAFVLVLLAGMATLAPHELAAAQERLFSLGQYGSDYSLRYRTTESKYVARAALAQPVAGAGLGASVFWGRPWDLAVPARDTFAHNGYLWMAWKLGIPTALLMTALLFAAIKPFDPSGPTDLFGGVQRGARGALLTLALVNVAFPAVNQLNITATLGTLMVISLCPTSSRASDADDGPTPLSDGAELR
jgi:O-antigen ligase